MKRFLLIPFIIALAYAVHSAFKYTRMISNIFLSLVYRPASEFYASRGERMIILDSKDREIEALLVEKKGCRKLLIFCHESGSSKESWEKYAYFIPALGYHVLSVDFNNDPPSGENSLSQWPTSPDVETLLTVIRWAKTALGSDLEIVLFGVSNGADIALAASFEYPGVAGVVADGLFSMKEIFRDYIRKWGPVLVKPNLFGERYPGWVVHLFANLGFWHCQRQSNKRFIDVEKFLRREHAPLLMIHGAKDDYVPAPHQALLERMSDKKAAAHHVVVPMARHNEAVLADRPRYERAVTEFLKGILVVCLVLGPADGFARQDAGAGVGEFKQIAAGPEETRLAGLLEKGVSAYEGLRDYRAVFHKQENSNGRLGPAEKIYFKFEKPFKIFLGWLNTRKKGLQVFYERGRHEGKLAVHTPGVFSALAPVIFLDPDSPWAREGSASYSIEDAGIGTFLYDFARAVLHAARERKLRVIFSSRKNAADLDGERVDVIFRNSRKGSVYFAYRVKVIFDGKTGLPVQMELFDWENRPMGIYAYRDLKLNVGADAEFKRLINKRLLEVYDHSR